MFYSIFHLMRKNRQSLNVESKVASVAQQVKLLFKARDSYVAVAPPAIQPPVTT